MDAISPFVTGFQVGAITAQLYREENSNRAGHHYHLLTATTQAGQLLLSASHFGVALGVEVQLIHYLGCIAIPAATAWAVATRFENPTLRSVVLLIHDNIGLVCQIANVVALIFFGHIWYSSAAISTIVLGLLDQHGTLPYEMRWLLHEVLFVLGNGLGLLQGGTLMKIISLLELVRKFGGEMLASLMPDPPVDHGRAALTPALIDQLTYGEVWTRLTINRGHITRPLPFDAPMPEADIRTIPALAESIDWSEESNARNLHAKLNLDDRTQEISTGDLSEVDFFKQELAKLVTSIADRQILQGEPRDYHTITNFLRKIAAHLQRPEISIQEKADILLRLAIDGGSYCGPAKIRVIEDLFTRNVLGLSEALSMEGKLLILLNQEREVILQGVLHDFYRQLPESVLSTIRPYDTHNYNALLNLIGRVFGVVSLAAENDSLAEMPFAMCAMYAYLVEASDFSTVFWNEYHRRILTYIQESVGTPYLATTSIYAWWQNWVDTNPSLTEQQRREWGTLLENGRLEYTIPNGTIRNRNDSNQALIEELQILQSPPQPGTRMIRLKYIAAMLIELGILRMPSQELQS